MCRIIVSKGGVCYGEDESFLTVHGKKLEEQLNAFIRNIPRKALIDVKFSTSGTNDSDSGELFNALVIYED